MKHRIIDFHLFSALLATLMCSPAAMAAQAPNPRGGVAGVVRADTTADTGRLTSRVATNVSRRAASSVAARDSKKVKSSTSRSAKRQTTAVSERPGIVTARVGSIGVVRSASPARSATNNVARNATSVSSVSRAASSRATAVFSDVSKIGGGYATCRDAYATCMDQFCANANDTYRRCYCSQRFTEFRDTELALDEAKRLLNQFQDDNLNAVDKTAAEVNAMYTATIGEAAIKKDVSGAQSILNEIDDLLSGKKKASKEDSNTISGLMDIDFGMDLDDIWSGGSSTSIFGGGESDSLADLEGQKLYKSANEQCLAVVTSSCENDAVLNMATSSYNIMITQDCNTYEKKVNTQRKGVEDSVRQAEKILREARLAEYRAHNSADVNECISKVRDAITEDMACGSEYVRCLDYSGVYINTTTGVPNPTPRLFELANQIKLNGNSDVLAQNSNFNKFLDEKRKFAESALDTCRDQADIVWQEFKRTALIEIAQAQDEKIEEVKNSCVTTVAECYDTQGNALKELGGNSLSGSVGAMAAYTGREMCKERVMTCAALYGGTSGCTFDANGKFTGTAENCGLKALLDFVNTVDAIKINDGCIAAIQENANEICTPTSGGGKYPSACFSQKKTYIEGLVNDRVNLVCNTANFGEFGEDIKTSITATIETIKKNIKNDIESALMDECEAQNGVWYSRDVVNSEEINDILKAAEPEALFYTRVFGGSVPNISIDSKKSQDVKLDYGICIENSKRYKCIEQDTMTGGNEYAKYDAATDDCVFTTEWYKWQCENTIGGYFENDICYWSGKASEQNPSEEQKASEQNPSEEQNEG